jgi:hypothetical protein
MVCCTGPGLTEALYILYIHKTCVWHVNKIKFWQWTKYCWQWLTSRQRDNTATFRQKISGHKFQSGLDTKTLIEWSSVVTWLWLVDRLYYQRVSSDFLSSKLYEEGASHYEGGEASCLESEWERGPVRQWPHQLLIYAWNFFIGWATNLI